MKITLALLKHLKACESGIDFFVRNNLEGFPLDKLDEVQGNYGNYLIWLKSKNTTIVDDKLLLSTEPHVLLGKKKNTKEASREYDSNGNIKKFTYTVTEKVVENGVTKVIYHTYCEKRRYEYINNVLHKVIDDDTGEVLLFIPEFK